MNSTGITSLAAAVAVAFSVSGVAGAVSPDDWNTVGAGCVPVGQTSNAQKVFNSAGDAGFASGAVGEIILTCPVPPTISGANNLSITFRDQDGAGVNARVTAVLRRKSLTTAAVSSLGSTIDSNKRPATATYATAGASIGSCGGVAFDFTRYAYYVQVNITRAVTAQGPLFATARLSYAIC